MSLASAYHGGALTLVASRLACALDRTARWLAVRAQRLAHVATAELHRAVQDAVNESGGGISIEFQTTRRRVGGHHASLVTAVRRLVDGARQRVEAGEHLIVLVSDDDNRDRIHVSVIGVPPRG